MKKFFYLLVLLILCGTFEAVEAKADSDFEKWTGFIEELQAKMEGKIPPPFAPVKTLAEKNLQAGSVVLDIGCETGKNAAVLIQNDHKVVLLDIVPIALTYTVENLRREGLDHGILDSLNVKIEDLDTQYGPFDAIVGTYAFSFIPPEQFTEIMTKNVFDRIEPGGYFAGGFFGEQHSWAIYSYITVLSSEQIEVLFSKAGFKILEITEEFKKPEMKGEQIKFHSFNVIAQKKRIY